MRHFFVINPMAGKKNDIPLLRSKIETLMELKGLDYEIAITEGRGHAVELTRQRAEIKSPLRVYGCGGDGTLNEVVNGAAGFSHVEVTQHPIGSGNDFIKIFGERAEEFLDIEKLVEGEAAAFDLIKCNDRYSINICSLGLDARIGTQMNRYKHIPMVSGKGAYILSAVSNLIKGIHEQYTINIEGEIHSGRYTMICVCNGRWYGGSFNAMPDAEPDDGILEVLLVKAMSRVTALRFIGRFAKGGYKEMSDMISHYRCRDISIICQGPSPINMEGELLVSDRAEISLISGGINFFYPRGLNWRLDGIKNGANTRKQQ